MSLWKVLLENFWVEIHENPCSDYFLILCLRCFPRDDFSCILMWKSIFFVGRKSFTRLTLLLVLLWDKKNLLLLRMCTCIYNEVIIGYVRKKRDVNEWGGFSNFYRINISTVQLIWKHRRIRTKQNMFLWRQECKQGSQSFLIGGENKFVEHLIRCRPTY